MTPITQTMCSERTAEHKKDQAIKRIGLLLGKWPQGKRTGILEGSKRGTIQGTFHRKVITELIRVITNSNLDLLRKWVDAAKRKRVYTFTGDVKSHDP